MVPHFLYGLVQFVRLQGSSLRRSAAVKKSVRRASEPVGKLENLWVRRPRRAVLQAVLDISTASLRREAHVTRCEKTSSDSWTLPRFVPCCRRGKEAGLFFQAVGKALVVGHKSETGFRAEGPTICLAQANGGC